MFAFSQIDPETRGQVMDMEVPMSKYLRASADQGLHDSFYAKWWRLNERWAEERDTDYPMLTVEEANKNYGTASLKFDAPVRENIAMMLNSQHQAQADRNFLLTNDNHTIVAGALGMSTTMLASMLNPVDLALMFVPIVGQETKLAAGANALGRGRAALRTGLITRETLQVMVPKAPKLAESIIQGASYMIAYEALNQHVSRVERTDPGNPVLNVAAGTAMAAVFHGVASLLGRLVFGKLPPEVNAAATNKAADDFVKGKDIDVTDIVTSTETFAALKVATEDISSALEPGKPFDFVAFQEKIRGIFRSKLDQLRKEVLPGKQKPIVPETPAEYEKTAFTSLFDEIRQRGLRTKEQIQKAFPEAQLTREEAAVLRREAWGEDTVKKQHADELERIIEKVRNQVLPEKQMGLKRQARLQAERNMPNPFKDEAELKTHLVDNKNPEKRVTTIDAEIKELKKKLDKFDKTDPFALDVHVTPTKNVSSIRKKGVLPDKEGKSYWWMGGEVDPQGMSEVLAAKGVDPADTAILGVEPGVLKPTVDEAMHKGNSEAVSHVGEVPPEKLWIYEKGEWKPLVKPKKSKAPKPEQVQLNTHIQELSKGFESNNLTPRDIANSVMDTFAGKRGYGELVKAAKKLVKAIDEDMKKFGGRSGLAEEAEDAFMEVFDSVLAKIKPEENLPPAEIAKALGVRYDGVQTWIAEQPKDVYTMMDKKNPFTVYVPEGSPKEVVESAFKAKVAENTPKPKVIETAVDCVAKQIPLV